MKNKFLIVIILKLIYLSVIAQPNLLVNTGARVSEAVFSLDGKLVACANANTVVIRDANTGKKIKSLTCEIEKISSLAFTSNNEYLLVGYVGYSGNGNATGLKLWNIKQGKVVKDYIGHTKGVTSVCFTNNDQQVISGSLDGTIRIWDFESTRVLKIIKTNQEAVSSVAYSGFKNIIASGGKDSSLVIWDAISGKKLHCFNNLVGIVPQLSFNKTGKYLASIDGFGEQTTIRNIETYTKEKAFGSNHGYGMLQFCNNDKMTLNSDWEALYIWDVRHSTKTPIHTFSPDKFWTINIENEIKRKALEKCRDTSDFNKLYAENPRMFTIDEYNRYVSLFVSNPGYLIKTVYYSEKQNKLISVGGYNSEIIVHWDIKTKQPIKKLKTRNIDDSKLNYSENLTYFARILNSEILIYSGKSGKVAQKINTENKKIKSVSFSKNEKLLLGIYKDKVFIWDVLTGMLLKQINNEGYEIKHADLTSDGNYIVCSGYDFVIVYDYVTRKKAQLILPEFIIGRFALSHDGSEIAISEYHRDWILNDDNSRTILTKENTALKIYETASGNLIAEWKPRAINEIDFSYNKSTIIASCEDDKVRVWNTIDQSLIRTIPAGRIEAINKDMVLTQSEVNNSNLELRNSNSGVKLQSYIGHTGNIYSAKISADGSKIISNTSDGEIITWDAKTGKKLLTSYYFENSSDFVHITPSGYFDGSKVGIENLHYVYRMNVVPLESFFEHFFTPNLYHQVMSGNFVEKNGLTINNLTLPPLVEIISPLNGIRSNTKEVEIKVKAIAQGSGIDNIQLYVNNKLVETTQRGFKKVQEQNETKIQTFTVQLANGENRIKATAFNNQRIESMPHEIIVFYEGAQKTTNLYMLVIGINNYKNPKYTLNYANADANSFKEIIKENCSNIFGSVNISNISNSEVTRSRINQEFQKINNTASQEDVFIFYYAGHGVMSEEVKSEFFIVPYDVIQMYGNNELLKQKGVSAKELQEYSRMLKPQKQLFVLDACQSGGMTDMLAMRGAAEEKAIAQLARSTGTYWLTASGSEQFATEFATLGHGVFTYAILQGLKGEADGGSKDKKITVKEISSFINDKVPELSEKHKGQAQYPTSYGYGQDFPIVIIKE